VCEVTPTHYSLSWMKEKLTYMQLALSFIIFQKDHNIFLPTSNNFSILANFSLPSLSKTNVIPL
jgi:hypothetical protein